MPLDKDRIQGEELATTLEKVVSQLDIITRTLFVLEQRVSQNEEMVSNVLDKYQSVKVQAAKENVAANFNMVGLDAAMG